MVFKSIHPLQLKGLCKSDDVNKQQKDTVTEAYAQDQKILSVQSSALMKAKEPQLIGMSQSIWP